MLSRKGLGVIQNPTSGTTYNANPQLYNLSLVVSPQLETLLTANTDSDGDTRARHWMDTARAKQAPWIETISGTFNIEYFELELGDPVTLQMNRYGYDAGELVQVVGIDINLTDAEVALRLCRRSTSSISADPGDPLPPEEPVPLPMVRRGRSALRFESGTSPPPPTMWTLDVQTEDSTALRGGAWVRFKGQASGDENVVIVGSVVPAPAVASLFEYSAGDYNLVGSPVGIAGRVASYVGSSGKVVHMAEDNLNAGEIELAWWSVSAAGYAGSPINNQTSLLVVYTEPSIRVAVTSTYTVLCPGGSDIEIYDADGANLVQSLDTTLGATVNQINTLNCVLFDNATTGVTEMYLIGDQATNLEISYWEISGTASYIGQWSDATIVTPPIGGATIDIAISENGLTLAIGGDINNTGSPLSQGVVRIIKRASLSVSFDLTAGGPWINYYVNAADNGSHAGLGRALSLSRDGSKLMVAAPLSDKGIVGANYCGRVWLIDTVSTSGVIDDDFASIREFTHNHDNTGLINSGYGVSVHCSGGTASTPTHFAIATSDAVGTNGKVDIWT
jgi:hypothetical protein